MNDIFEIATSNTPPLIKVVYDEPPVVPPEQLVSLQRVRDNLPRAQWRSVGRIITVKVFDDVTTVTTGDGKFIFEVPSELNGTRLVGVRAFVSTVSSSGTPTVSLYNLTTSVDLLSTSVTIDANEYSSQTAATPPVIDQTKNLLTEGDRIEVNVDVAGTGAKGLLVYLSIQ